MATGPTTLPPELAGETLEAVLQAYADYDAGSSPYKPTPPPGYTSYVYRFYGWEGIIDKDVVKFGLIFQSGDVAGRYLVAFRGTEDDIEWVEDFDWTKSPFPGDASVAVARGFLDAYTLQPHGMAVASMRDQLASWIEQTRPASLIITGHSLGGALASLFAYDLARSKGIPTSFVTYASPNVGTSAWQSAFNAAFPAAVRVFNTEDVVPYAPPVEFFGYEPVGISWPVEFEPWEIWNRVTPLALATNHSCRNYQYVVNLAASSTPPAWVGTFMDLGGPTSWLMGSWAPSEGRGKLRLETLCAYLKALKAIPPRGI